ncbi:hypothetical protein DTO013E5_1877 [Penicillium roqueforti]|uniref:Homeodomain-like n=1 Tax=Penicillium roqueforti (strain FM164) TaxID=1365484 RepID=W6Q6D1_PENRF|nr:uncharacterized protein LCP9604111_163 [Penicillium roqueforti]CDM31885.1 Homeodomain-like [Penicillium roqueforti FM164]KAF9252637.1 hypothetical protein LCP9604111_163 [Penicillium roqueforti]KAI1835696.1 hypothetical protein CBS147337_3719 [Penicillium roqueforti]KAI2675453.1 hypothetical protein CBS147355_6447 [Penicillium roqueforti]KAI2687068.1 hypothetical protein LCP963914a_3669 [Penicillium roqueforti]
MESASALRPLDESILRELPQLSLRIAPLREPVSSRTLSVPSPLEPNASGTREPNNIPNSNSNSGKIPANAKAGLPTVTEFLNAARIRKTELSADSQSNVERPPRPILPAFVNLRALEKFPFSSSFDDDALQGPRKRRRRDPQADSFSEHLQLPIPQAQKEQRPPPFGPFAILNGLNEPPPNAALLPPIEAGSNISQLLTKPSRGGAAVDPGTLVAAHVAISDGQSAAERRDTRLEDILRMSLNVDEDDDPNDNDENVESTNPMDPDEIALAVRKAEDPKNTKALPLHSGQDVPISPKTRGRSRKNVRKWTEEETATLLRGVVKCGIGNWTAILAQPELEFNQRTASNLKDRFRVLCPWAYRTSDPNEAAKQLHDTLANTLLKAKGEGSDETPGKPHLSHIMPSSQGSESISGAEGQAPNPQKPSTSSTVSSTPDTDPGSSSIPQSQSPSSGNSTPAPASKSQTTLASLGIPANVVKSKRRSRRPFTAVEDEALLKGYAVHGFQWTLIQQDSRLNLSHRKATDLRDRFRTKFPHAYRDGGSVNGKAFTNPNQGQGQDSAAGASTPRPHPVNTEQSPSKAYAMTPTPTPNSTTASRNSASRSRHAATPSQSSLGQIDPALLPPPPQSFSEHSMYLPPAAAGALSFSLDDGPGAGAASTVETPWEDNTLAPMIWDELT